MALGTITRNTSNPQSTSDASVGSLKVTNTDIVGDSSYPTGGSTLTPAQLGLGTVVFAISSGKLIGTNSPSEVYYDIPNQKLKVFAGAAEMASTLNLSTSTFQVTAFGY
jgi:hypothetical protein